MEDEKKKKRQKKKKNKQARTTATVSAGVGEQASEDNNLVNGTEQIHQNLDSETADSQNESLQKSDVDSDRQPINSIESSIPVEAEKLYWLDREASLEQKIKVLQEELDASIRKEADLETNILQSQNERNSWLHKEVEMETRISHLQAEKDSWVEKEAGYEGKINQLVVETATLHSIRVSLEEKIAELEQEKVSWEQKEKSEAETIASLNKDNARLRAQVIELEASRSDFFHQNEQLKEHVSDLQSKIQTLEESVAGHSSSERTMNEDTNSQLEPSQALVEKLLSENEKLIEKVNTLNAELDQRRLTSLPPRYDDTTVASAETAVVADGSAPGADLTIESAKTAGNASSSALGTDPMSSTAERPENNSHMVPMSGPRESILSDKIMESLKDEVMRLKSNNVNYMNFRGSDTNPGSRESMESGEIVQIPLDENEVALPEFKPSPAPEKADVPLTDAPLVGAPFRLISFVARYVSGADLVKK